MEKLHRRDSELVRLFTGGELRDRVDNINTPAPAFDMEDNFHSGPSEFIFPGDKRRDCKARQRDLGRVVKPVGLSIMSCFSTII